MIDALLDIAVDLTKDLSARNRYQRLLVAVRRVLPCDASALLKYESSRLVPVAIDGLSRETLGRRFDPSEHPRFQQILSSRLPVRFPADCTLPDPYDGLVEGHEGSLAVHACMGCSLYLDDQLLGILTLDGLTPGMFDSVDDQTMATFSALAAAAMRTAILIDGLEDQARHKQLVAQELISEALHRDGGELIGCSEAMQHLATEIGLVAATDLSVLITGETGVGKELVARTLHLRSRRAAQPLVYINCAALPESIAESELFGHTKGAFTGATADRGGKFELADGGTLFLDEIGELPLTLQAKMLRVLQSGEIQRVGSDKVRHVDVRVLAATNRHLATEVEEGRFRRDLYHRLNVFPVDVPPLRERCGDVPLLVGFFIEKMRVKLGLKSLCIAPAALLQLQQCTWPGNVRELEHVISRAALRARALQQGGMASIQVAHCDVLPDSTDNAGSSDRRAGTDVNLQMVDATLPLDSGDSWTDPLSDTPEKAIAVATITETATVMEPEQFMTAAIIKFQRKLIAARLQSCEQNWSQTARSLGMDRGNLHRLARRLGLK